MDEIVTGRVRGVRSSNEDIEEVDFLGSLM